MAEDIEELKAQLDKANNLLGRIVDSAEVMIDEETHEPIDDDEALISDELFQEVVEYCDEFGIETNFSEETKEH